MRAALKPTDFIEEGWVQDFVYHTFEIIRFRTLKAKLFAVRANATMIDVLEGLLSEHNSTEHHGALPKVGKNGSALSSEDWTTPATTRRRFQH